jgi:hypothetical protein
LNPKPRTFLRSRDKHVNSSCLRTNCKGLNALASHTEVPFSANTGWRVTHLHVDPHAAAGDAVQDEKSAWTGVRCEEAREQQRHDAEGQKHRGKEY